MKFKNSLVIFILMLAAVAFIFCKAEQQDSLAQFQPGKKIKGNTSRTLENLMERINQDHESIKKAFLARDWEQMYKIYEDFREKGESVVIETQERKYMGAAAITDYWRSASKDTKDLIIEVEELRFKQIISTEIEVPENYIDAKAIVYCAFHIITENNHTIRNRHDYYHIRGCDWGH